MGDAPEESIESMQSLRKEEQEAVASEFTETLDHETGWIDRFRRNPTLLMSLADEALREHRRGETSLLNELLN